MSRRNPPAKWTLPAVVNPGTRKCFTINVPDEPYHLAAFRGALLALGSAYNWADDVDHTAKDVALVWRGVIADMADCGYSPPFACPYDFTANNGNWQLIIDANLNPDHIGAYAFPTGWYDTAAHNISANHQMEGVRIEKLFSPAIVVTHVTMEYDLIKGTFEAPGYDNVIFGFLAGNLVFSTAVDSDTDPDGYNKFLESSPGGIQIDQLVLIVTCGVKLGSSNPGGSVAIRYCEINGLGEADCDTP